MHELSLCRAIAETVAAHAEGRRVERVRLRVGHLRQVVPDTLAACWRLHTAATPLAGSTLAIDDVPAVIECVCGERTTLDEPILRCGACGAADVALIAGEELLIESIDVREHDPIAEEIR